MPKCQSRILKEYKTTKADMMWPETVYGPNDVGTLPTCGGDVTVKARAVDEPDWGGSSASLKLEWTCTRCKHAFLPGRIEADRGLWDGLDVTRLFE